MPLFAWIIIGILLFIAILVLTLLLSKIKLVLSYENDFSICAKFLFLKFKLYPEKEKKEKKKKKKKPSVQTQKPIPKKPEKKKPGVLEVVFAYRDIIIDIVKEFAGKLHFKFVKINIKISTDDAAKTALTYSCAVQGVSYLVSFLENYSNVDMEKSSINVYTDFLSEESEFQGSVCIHTRIFIALPVIAKIIKLIAKIKLKTED